MNGSDNVNATEAPAIDYRVVGGDLKFKYVDLINPEEFPLHDGTILTIRFYVVSGRVGDTMAMFGIIVNGREICKQRLTPEWVVIKNRFHMRLSCKGTVGFSEVRQKVDHSLYSEWRSLMGRHLLTKVSQKTPSALGGKSYKDILESLARGPDADCEHMFDPLFWQYCYAFGYNDPLHFKHPVTSVTAATLETLEWYLDAYVNGDETGSLLDFLKKNQSERPKAPTGVFRSTLDAYRAVFRDAIGWRFKRVFNAVRAVHERMTGSLFIENLKRFQLSNPARLTEDAFEEWVLINGSVPGSASAARGRRRVGERTMDPSRDSGVAARGRRRVGEMTMDPSRDSASAARGCRRVGEGTIDSDSDSGVAARGRRRVGERTMDPSRDSASAARGCRRVGDRKIDSDSDSGVAARGRRRVGDRNMDSDSDSGNKPRPLTLKFKHGELEMYRKLGN